MQVMQNWWNLMQQAHTCTYHFTFRALVWSCKGLVAPSMRQWHEVFYTMTQYCGSNFVRFSTDECAACFLAVFSLHGKFYDSALSLSHSRWASTTNEHLGRLAMSTSCWPTCQRGRMTDGPRTPPPPGPDCSSYCCSHCCWRKKAGNILL